MKQAFFQVVFLFWVCASTANSILIPMDGQQKDHLKAYGIAYHTLTTGIVVDWLLNYRGGSFLVEFSPEIESECRVRGVSFEIISAAKVNTLLNEIASPAVNMNVVRMEKAPRVAVYSPKSDLIADETDAVILVLEYAEIPFAIIYDEEIHNGELVKYDWLHLHHEDFTGQVAKLRWRESAAIEIKVQEATAAKLGYRKISEMKLAIAKRIKSFCAGGGYLFAMCSAAETIDIALAADGFDFDALMFEADGESSSVTLNYDESFAFEDFTLESTYNRRFSDINVRSGWGASSDYFTLFNFSAKWDVVPALLTQNHTHVIKEFTGLTTAFHRPLVKPEVLILGENKKENNARYLYGELGKGHWTFYSGHDPEGVAGRGRGPTDLSLHPNSPGYRLILNNVLFPSAQKKKQKT